MRCLAWNHGLVVYSLLTCQNPSSVQRRVRLYNCLDFIIYGVTRCRSGGRTATC